ncbi:MAG: ABC transporter permease subunit [bacterium]|nr:ABC transporter permease subunit [bacterium]MDE0417351.1 ABC transporter permease subunit [bacterium]
MRRLARLFYLAVIAVISLYLLLPTLVVALASVSPTAMLSFPPSGFSLEWYGNFLARDEFTESFVISVLLAAFAALVSTGLAVVAATGLRRVRRRARQFVAGLALFPIILPTIVYGPALLLLSGSLGVTQSMWLTLLVIAGAHLVLSLPFAVQICFTSYDDLDPAMEEAAVIAGAGHGRVLRRIVVPLLIPGILASLMFAFLISFDEPVVSLFMSRHDVVTLPVRILTYMRFRPDPTIAAISTIMSLLALLAIIVVDRQIGLDRILGLRR